jgi:hypothetical protein
MRNTQTTPNTLQPYRIYTHFCTTSTHFITHVKTLNIQPYLLMILRILNFTKTDVINSYSSPWMIRGNVRAVQFVNIAPVRSGAMPLTAGTAPIPWSKVQE